MKLAIKITFISLLAGALNQPAIADSFYSAFGLGVPQYYVSSQAVGMGGAGIGVGQYLSINSLNPAAVRLKGFTMISASFRGEIADNTVSGSTVTTRQGNAAGFQFAIPMYKNRVAVIASLKPLVKSQLTVDFEEVGDDFDLLRTINTSGGISAASLGLNYAVLPGVFIAGLFNFNFGAFNEMWKTDFDNDSYRSTQDDITSHLWGTGAELGLLIRPFGFFSIGGVVKASSKLNIETTKMSSSGAELTPIEQTATYPLAVGAGFSFDFTKVLIAGDIYTQRWESYAVDGQKSDRMTNYTRVGAGIEFVRSKDYLSSYFKRVLFRLGASYAQLPFLDTNGDAATEMFMTGGLGFPFNKNAGRIDLALEVGERSSTEAYPYSESLIRVSASITMAEKWFQRLY